MSQKTPYETASWVDSRVAIGGFLAAGNPALLKAAGITHVVSMIRPQDAARFADITYFYAPSLDTVDFDIRAAAVAAAAQTLRWARAGHRVLVHCHAGISRSATAVLMYRMALGNPLADALAQLQAARPVVRPNPRFMLVLLKADRDLRRARPRRTAAHAPAPLKFATVHTVQAVHAAASPPPAGRANLLRQDHDLPGAELGELVGPSARKPPPKPKNLSAVELAHAKETSDPAESDTPPPPAEWHFHG